VDFRRNPSIFGRLEFCNLCFDANSNIDGFVEQSSGFVEQGSGFVEQGSGFVEQGPGFSVTRMNSV